MIAAALATAALAALLAPAPAQAAEGDWWIEGDQYREVLIDRSWSGLSGRVDWTAKCPTDFPYLDTRAGTDGRSLGRGIIAWEGDWGVDLVAELETRTFAYPLPLHKLVTGMSGYVKNNRLDGRQAAQVHMVCTSNLQFAWNVWA